MGCAQSKKHQVYKTEFPKPPRPAAEVELEEAREAIRLRAAEAAAEAERAAAQERRMQIKAQQAAKRAAASAEEAQRALQTLEKLKDPDFDPLNLDDYDDTNTTVDSAELKEKPPTVQDKLKMFENLALENAAAAAEEQSLGPPQEWGDVPPPPKKLTLPKAFAGMEQSHPPPLPPVRERRPPPGHIIFPDDPRIYKAKTDVVTSPVTPPPKGRDDFIPHQNDAHLGFKFDMTSPHSTSPTTEPDMSPTPPETTLLSPAPAPSDLIPKPPAVVVPEMPLRESKLASHTIVTYSRSVDGKLAAYERRDAAARAAPVVEDVQVSKGRRVTGHLSKYESLDAAARAVPTTEDVSVASPGKRISGHLNKYESLDAAARAPLPPPIDLNESTGATVAERLRWSEHLESCGSEDCYRNDDEYHSLKSIERRQALIFQRAGLAPVRELGSAGVTRSANMSRHLAAYELRDRVAKAGPPPKDDIAAGGRRSSLTGMLAMYEAKDEAARAEKEIESIERRSVVAAMTRQRLVE